ncbi:molybdate ABC transporter substrate-binding protein [Pseudohoeflea coraliihabitans]|uniref:Molybdate ABC transporter substrate-binding protein n=1 Tax=Pseudohoeflea coraliihabitans TaxID=2860393 RepID=A0ABS6WJR6_9HYPH|nr:molybdate ABC transporter substrate-binding protein [Pseudohoeflea sp. DP4N28-3]MBW3096181.1 molybdate ABC transporter substrate-binding protein [Pseudohoeflea sp. DP4N28-3]
MDLSPPLRTALRILAIAIGLASGPAAAEKTLVAVAANFTAPAEDIAAAFAAASGHQAVLSYGATGQLFAQIMQGAPYEVFLAADAERPARALAEGLAVAGSGFTYAVGRLALYGREPGTATGPDSLHLGPGERIAIANPDLAPYGRAAIEVMQALDLEDRLRPTFVIGTTIAQAFQFVETGNTAIGFVALAQVIGRSEGNYWPVPASLHAPIRQDAVLLAAGKDNPAARVFLDFLRSEAAHKIIAAYGYDAAMAE